MPRKSGAAPVEIFFEAVFDILKMSPVWVGPVLSIGLYCLVSFLLPLALPDKPPLSIRMIWTPALHYIGIGFGLFTLFLWLVAEFNKFKARLLFDRNTNLDSIRSLSWSKFESFVAEAYRRQGYQAVVKGSSGGDGGVDVELRGHGEFVLVQCKQLRVMKVGVVMVRELLGVVTSERATRGILITSGNFSSEAIEFAEKNKIELVDGRALERLIDPTRVQGKLPEQSEIQSVQPSERAPRCPKCDSPMVTRVAKKGANAGSQFSGCPRFPQCLGTRKLER